MQRRFFQRAVAIAGAVLLLVAGPAVGAVKAAQAPGWRIAAVLQHCGDDSLSSIVATGPRDAWALGQPPWSTAPGCGADVEHWDGTAWRRVAVPGSVFFGLGFPTANPITATSASDAWIFPSRGEPIGLSGHEYDYALHWNGTTWRASSFPGKLSVQSAADLRPNDVWAFGVTYNSAYTTVPYTAHNNGRAWQRVRLPVAPLAVSAAGRDDLWAIGPTVATANKPASQQHIIAMRWNGRSWTGLAVPKIAVPGGQSRFNASIVATGGSRDLWWYYQATNDDNSTSRSGLLHWNGTAWHAFSLSAAIVGVDAMTKDGHGGIWLKADVGIASDQYFYHYNHGRWSRSLVPSPRNYLNWVFGLAWIPGTTSVWADGEADGNVHTVGVIVKYGS